MIGRARHCTEIPYFRLQQSRRKFINSWCWSIFTQFRKENDKFSFISEYKPRKNFKHPKISNFWPNGTICDEFCISVLSSSVKNRQEIKLFDKQINPSLIFKFFAVSHKDRIRNGNDDSFNGVKFEKIPAVIRRKRWSDNLHIRKNKFSRNFFTTLKTKNSPEMIWNECKYLSLLCNLSITSAVGQAYIL